MRPAFALAAALALAAPALAQAPGIDELASVLASEVHCALAYDADALREIVGRVAPAHGAGFAADLDARVRLAALLYDGQGASARVAHCAAIEAIARDWGLID